MSALHAKARKAKAVLNVVAVREWQRVQEERDKPVSNYGMVANLSWMYMVSIF